MFRNLILASAALIGVGAPLGGLATADAAHPVRVEVGRRVVRVPVVRERVYLPPVYCPPVTVCPEPVCTSYAVEYRRSCTEPWIVYGSYGTQIRAHEFEHVLGHRGFEVRVRHH